MNLYVYFACGAAVAFVAVVLLVAGALYDGDDLDGDDLLWLTVLAMAVTALWPVVLLATVVWGCAWLLVRVVRWQERRAAGRGA